MPFRLSFNLNDADLRHFEEVAQQTQVLARERSPESIIAAAREVLEKGEQAHVAQFVRERFARLRTMIDMATDADWQPREEDRQRLLNALACFSTPSGDRTSGVALLDHAIMIELIGRDFEHDIDAFQAFCRYRAQAAKRVHGGVEEQREQWLAQKRAELHTRMRERRQRDLDRAGSAVKKFFSLLGL
jgi:hypothetical protein